MKKQILYKFIILLNNLLKTFSWLSLIQADFTYDSLNLTDFFLKPNNFPIFPDSVRTLNKIYSTRKYFSCDVNKCIFDFVIFWSKQKKVT